MKKFLILYHAPKSAMKQMEKSTPEQAKAGMNAWIMMPGKCTIEVHEELPMHGM